ncbi:metallophosphoesterase family protein [Rhizobiaceae bacterium]|nr:metallophosphoesterase family protein [Rhizobiaceae bacterium]
MRISAFSDLHRDLDAARAVVDASEGADVLLGAGDYGTRGEGTRELLDVLATARCPLVLVWGNHDDVADVRNCASTHEHVHVLHGSGVEIGGRKFFGLGGETPIRNDADWNFGVGDDEARALLAGCPGGAFLLTHNPPLGHADEQRDGSHEGSAAILGAIQRSLPPLHMCGHIHNAWGRSSAIGVTAVHNIGPTAVPFHV